MTARPWKRLGRVSVKSMSQGSASTSSFRLRESRAISPSNHSPGSAGGELDSHRPASAAGRTPCGASRQLVASSCRLVGRAVLDAAELPVHQERRNGDALSTFTRSASYYDVTAGRVADLDRFVVPAHGVGRDNCVLTSVAGNVRSVQRAGRTRPAPALRTARIMHHAMGAPSVAAAAGRQARRRPLCQSIRRCRRRSHDDVVRPSVSWSAPTFANDVPCHERPTRLATGRSPRKCDNSSASRGEKTCTLLGSRAIAGQSCGGSCLPPAQ
jgi:hypothetical protein